MNIVLDNHSTEEIRVKDHSKQAEIHFGKTDRRQGVLREHKRISPEKTSPAFTRDHAPVLPGQEREKNSALVERQEQKGQETVRKMELVLSHTLSSTDYQRAKREGFDLSKIDFEETVTIMDHIKAAVLAGGEEVNGFTDQVDLKKLEEITGSASRAIQLKNSFDRNDLPITEENVEAVRKALELNEKLVEPPPEAIQFLLENQSEISLKNLYVAEHTCAEDKGKTVPGKGDGEEKQKLWLDPNMRAQIRNLIQNAGLTDRQEEAEDTARKLFAKDAPLTKENLKMAVELRSQIFPLSFTKLTELAAAALADGKEPQNGSVLQSENLYRRALEIEEKVSTITEDQLSEVLENGSDLTIHNLAEAKGIRGQDGIALLSARRQLEEVRLAMSVEVNLVMLRKGIQIDTIPMKKLIQELDLAIEEKAVSLFGKSTSETEGVEAGEKAKGCVTKYRLYLETNAKIESMKGLPIGVLGAMKGNFEEDTLDDIFTGAQTWKLRNKAALDLYEQMQTEVRSDLGDDIQKAFARVDSLLEENGFEVNEDNRRAVRALGRNRMEISPENLSAVRALDARIRQVVHCMKPAAVLDMIRQNKNPLKMTLEELTDYFRQREQDPVHTEEKYARFLYKLDRTGGITEAEKESYIGIYRLFANLEKTDHAAIAYLLNTGAEVTVKNLLGAQRSLQTGKKGIRVIADQGFTGIDLMQNQLSISEQIESAFSYYGSKSSHIFSLLEPEKLHEMKNDRGRANPEEATLVEMERAMQEIGSEEALERELELVQRAELDEIFDQSEAARKLLRGSGISVHADHLLGAKKILKDRSGAENRHLVTQEEEITGRKSGLRKLMDALGEEEDYQDFYRKKLAQTATELQGAAEDEKSGYLDIKAIMLLHKQLSVMSAMAKTDHFEIPIDCGNGMVSMSVTLKRKGEKKERPEVAIVLEGKEGSTLRANLRVENGAAFGEIEISDGNSLENKRRAEELEQRFFEMFAEEYQGETNQVKELLRGARCLVRAAAPLYENNEQSEIKREEMR